MNQEQTDERDAKRMEKTLQHPDHVTMASIAPLLTSTGKIMEELCRGVSAHDAAHPAQPIPQDLRDALTELANLMELVSQKVELGARQEEAGITS